MRKKHKKAAASAVFLYLLLAGGSWMFINSYVNSYNRLSGDKITAASLTVSGGNAGVRILNKSADIDLSPIMPDSKLYCGAYILSPDEIRSAAYLISLLPLN